MKRRYWFGKMILLGFGAGLAFGNSAQAETMTTSLDFSVADQSMWKAGSAGSILINDFYGLTWNTAVNIDATAELEQDVYVGTLDLGTYGVGTDITSTGKFGVGVQGEITGGYVNIDAPMTLSMTVDHDTYYNYGDPVTIGTQWSLLGGAKFTTQSPTVNASVDLYHEITLDVDGKFCFVDCGSKNFDLIPDGISGTTNLVTINAADAKFSASLLGIDIYAAVPNIATTGDFSSFTTSGSAPHSANISTSSGGDLLFKINGDIDNILTTITGLPPLSVDLSVGDYFSLKGDLLDIDLSTQITQLQGFQVSLFPKYTLDFSVPVYYQRFLGDDVQLASSITVNFGADLIIQAPFKSVDVTTSYSLDYNFSNKTDLNVSTSLDLLVGSLDAYVDYIVGNWAGTIGPMYSDSFSLVDTNISMFNDMWQVRNAQTIAGEAFTIDVANQYDFLSKAYYDDLRSDITELPDDFFEPQSKLAGLVDTSLNEGSDDRLFQFIDTFMTTDGTLAKATWGELALLLGDYAIDFSQFFTGAPTDDYVGIEFAPYFKDEELVSLGLAFVELEKDLPELPWLNYYTKTKWEDLYDVSLWFSFHEGREADLFLYGQDIETENFKYLFSSFDARTADPVPEPATMLLFGTGLAGLAGARMRRKKTRN